MVINLTEEQKKDIYNRLVDVFSSKDSVYNFYLKELNGFLHKEKISRNRFSDTIGFCFVLMRYKPVISLLSPIEDIRHKAVDDILEDLWNGRKEILTQIGIVPQKEDNDAWFDSYESRLKELKRIEHLYK